MNNVMVDLETMGTNSDAAIISIGAVKFDLKNQKITDRFDKVVDLKSSMAAGLKVDPDTITWWLQQSDEARAPFKQEATDLKEALQDFAIWIGDDAKIWGNGAAFDNVILENAYRACELPIPWPHYNNRCYRTIAQLNRHIRIERSGVYHCAIDDAENQANHFMKILTN